MEGDVGHVKELVIGSEAQTNGAFPEAGLACL